MENNLRFFFVNFSIIAPLIFFGYFQEIVTQTNILVIDGEREVLIRWESMITYTFFCFVMITTTCFIFYLFAGKKSRLLIPSISSDHVAASFFMTSALILTNMSLEYVPYAAKILIKSCRPIPVFLATLCVSKERYASLKILSVILLLVGILVYMRDESGAFNNSALFGNTMLFISICFDGLAAVFFERIRANKEEKDGEDNFLINTLELVASVNFIAIFFCIPALFINLDVIKAFNFISLQPEITMPILTSTFTYALGQIAIGASYLQFGTLSTSMAQTLRIMITLLGTVYLFHDPFSHLQMIGTSFMLLGIICNFAQSFRAKNNEESSDQQRKKSILEDLENVPLVDSDYSSDSSTSTVN